MLRTVDASFNDRSSQLLLEKLQMVFTFAALVLTLLGTKLLLSGVSARRFHFRISGTPKRISSTVPI
jgi:hypothetical protein